MSNACYYVAGFNIQRENVLTPLGTLTLTHSGESNIVITLGNLLGTDLDSASSGFVWHFVSAAGTQLSLASNDGTGGYAFRHYSTTSLGGLLTTAINARCAIQDWPTFNFLVQFHEENGSTPLAHYRFTYPTAFTYTFSTQAGADLFGALLTGGSAATSYVLGTPSYCWQPSGSAGGQSISVDGENEALEYEPEGIGTLVHADDGRGFMNARTVSPLYMDWVHQNVTPGRMFRERATTPLWTAQHLYEHCRRGFPFYVAHGRFVSEFEYLAFQLRTAGSHWKPRRVSIANDVFFDLPFKCASIGHLTTPS